MENVAGLPHDQRITLDDAPAEVVDAAAKDLATKQLAKLTAKKATPAVTKPKPPLRGGREPLSAESAILAAEPQTIHSGA